MKISFIILSLLMLAGPGRAGEPALIPWPARVAAGDGHFAFNPQTVIIAEPGFTNEAAWLAAKLHLPIAAAAAANRIQFTTQDAAALGDEAYRLDVNPQGATLHARAAAGAFYGAVTLAQWMDARAQTVPCGQIEDAPRYAWRGFMLDVSRHYFDGPTLRQLLDWMAEYKLNRFHLHLTDDQGWRLEMTQYPELTRAGARGDFTDSNAPARFFTQAEMRDIVRYAAQRHIVVVPEIDMPGHAAAALRSYPALDGGGNTFNPVSEPTFDFLNGVLRETMEIFPSPWIHFGGDEVKAQVWETNSTVARHGKADGVRDARQLEAVFARRIADFITAQGRTPAGWDEITAAGTAPSALIYWWRHDKPEVLQQALASGHPVVLAPRAPCYFDYPQDKSVPSTGGWKLWNTPADVYRGPTLPASLTTAERKQIAGVEGCVWTERIATVPRLEFMVLPRLVALAELAWTPDDQRDFTRFSARLQPHLEEYRRQGVQFYDAANPAGNPRAASAESAHPPPRANTPESASVK